ncbi:envelope glycoprotein B [Rhynchospora pubera]|uniref:Envelope glycoprotein B n=1 Tax=Rhynchospora pubera TaxID=906938 RepID=A0AAV8HNI3_9POAL|nr:envelope glycoprotein B [Rhynchospora pubera]
MSIILANIGDYTEKALRLNSKNYYFYTTNSTAGFSVQLCISWLLCFYTGKEILDKPNLSTQREREREREMAFQDRMLSLSLCSLLLLLAPPLILAHVSLEPQEELASGKKVGGLVSWRRSVAEAPEVGDVPVENGSFVLAQQRTYRRDPLDGYKKYNGGWNISNNHYWASVGFTAAPLFAIALAWFVGFGLALAVIGICYCCFPKRSYSYSRTAYALSLILLILFTLAAIVGCVVLYTGQGKFYRSTTTTVEYVVGQANYTVENLRNFSDSLAAAKRVDVDQFFLPSDVMNQIDTAQVKLNSSASNLESRTLDNSRKIKKALNSVRLALVIVAAVMLFLAFVGFCFSIYGWQFIVSLLVVVGWILVTGTFILCGIFLLLHNVVADTCVSMDDWAMHPHMHTALDDILPCVDAATANDSFYKGREVTSQLVNLVNQVISNVSNQNIAPNPTPLYFNQSGPLMPLLCNPYNGDLSNHSCSAGEVDLYNATQVWKGYECETKVVSGREICSTAGRVTPRIYNQMAAAVNVSQGLYQYGPFLNQLEDCTFVRDTFTSIDSNNCPGLEKYSRWVYIGLVMVSAAVMLSLVFWVVYARERRHRVYNKQFAARSGQGTYPVQDKASET